MAASTDFTFCTGVLDGNSVGRKTAGMYMGRVWRVMYDFGDVGDPFPEVLRGEIWGLYCCCCCCWVCCGCAGAGAGVGAAGAGGCCAAGT